MVKPTRKRGPKQILCAVLLSVGLFAESTAGWAAPTPESGSAVDLELILAVDVSDSIDRREARLQRDGYVAALTDPAVLAAIRAGRQGRIAISYIEWAGLDHYAVIIDWTVIDGEESAAAIAGRLAAAPLVTVRRTSISDAIRRSAPRFRDNGYHAPRHILDISGDGPNNYGDRVTTARDAAVAQGITINGLAILPAPSEPETHGGLRQLDLYYEDCVIGGPGAFVLTAKGYGSFADAIRRKMVREIANHPPEARLQRASAAADRPACNIGEWLWFGADR